MANQVTDFDDFPPLPNLPQHPFREPLTGWEASEVAAIIKYARAYAAEAVRLARLQALEDAALLADARMKTADDVRRHEAEAIAWLIRELKDRT